MIRLQKYLSEAGVLSRRRAEKEIIDGNILVNGEKAELGRKIDPLNDSVTYRGTLVSMLPAEKRAYIMLNKPTGFVTTLSDERGRKCVNDLVSDAKARVWPCGRLDMDSEGLLILTNDGDLTNRLTHPLHRIPKIYHVKINGKVEQEVIKKLNMPMEIDGYEILPVKTDVVSFKDNYTILKMELYEGRNRQIRKMCEKYSLEIIKLKRIAIGELNLGNLPPGKWKYLTSSQVKYLKGLE